MKTYNNDPLIKALNLRKMDAVDVDATLVYDANGKAHAPHDGFSLDGKIYKGGEYVHSENQGGLMKCRLKMSLRDVMFLQESRYPVSHGKSWDQAGESICYAYFEGPKSIIQAIESISPKSGKTLRLHDENCDKRGAAFKFNMRQISKIERDYGIDDFEVMLDLYGLGEVPLSSTKQGKWTSPWKGKMVSFYYHDDVYRLKEDSPD